MSFEAIARSLVQTGRIADLVIALMVLEAVALLGYHRAKGLGIPPRNLMPNLLAGLFLVLALRVALSDGGAAWLAFWLGCAFAAHLADLASRWRGR